MNGPAIKQRVPCCAILLVLSFAALGELLWVVRPGQFGLFSLKFITSRHDSMLHAREQDDDKQYIAPYVPTPQEVVDRMLELAEIREGDVVYDLGSGDGRIVITAARRYGVKAVGFEINPALVQDARESIAAAGLGQLVEIREQDLRTVDLSPASVVTMYLYPGANLRLRSAILRQLRPGSRVVSHQFGMGAWQPDRVDRLTDSTGISRTIYVWRIK
jgi:SAM-dependent methyltransferase